MFLKTATRSFFFQLSLLSILCFALTFIGCASAFSKAMKRGDEFANAQMWEEAARAYEEAVALKPNDSRASVLLRHARNKQAENHMAQARIMLGREDYLQAITFAQQALSLAPDHVDHQREFNEILTATVTYASKLTQEKQFHRALELANLVLDVSPEHENAKALASEIHRALAVQHYERAQGFFQQGLQGNAIVELAASLGFVPNFPQAHQQLTDAHTALRNEITLRIALTPSEESQKPDTTDILSANLLANTIDPAIAIEILEQPTPNASLLVSASGLQVSYRKNHRSLSVSCDYVCGVDHHPNPDHQFAEGRLSDAERRLASLEQEGSQAESVIGRHQRDVDEAEQRVSREESNLDSQRRDLESCRHRNREERDRCHSERNRVQAAERDLERVRRDLESERKYLIDARDRWSNIHNRIANARDEKNRALETMRLTPRTVAVDRTCSNTYLVDQYSHTGHLGVNLLMQEPSGRIYLQEPRNIEADRTWLTHPAHPNRCPTQAKEPPSPLPSEKDLRQELDSQLNKQISQHIVEFAKEKQAAIRAKALKAQTEGNIDEAIEGLVRFAISGLMDQETQSRFDDLLRRTRGIEGIRLQ